MAGNHIWFLFRGLERGERGRKDRGGREKGGRRRVKSDGEALLGGGGKGKGTLLGEGERG